MKKLKLVYCLSIFVLTNFINAATITSTQTGSWTSGTTWVGGVVPTTGDFVVIANGHTVTLSAAANIGSGTVTVQSGGVLDLSSFALTANTLTIDNGGEVKQGGSSGAPSGTITTRSYAATSNYTFYGTQAGLSGTHPIYGNLIFSPTPSSAGTFGVGLNVVGNLTINLGATFEVRFATGTTSRTHNIGGNLLIQGSSIVVGNNGSTAISSITIGGNLTVSAGTFRGTNDAGNVTFNIAGNITNNSTWQLDDGSSTGTFEINLNGSSTQSINGLAPFSLEKLTINNSSGISINQSVSLSGILTLTSGDISTGSNTLTISSTGSISRTSGHIIGNLKKNVATGATSRTFEVGTASGYSPVTVAFGNVSVAGDLTCSSTQTTHPNVVTANESLNRFWTLTNSGITFDNYSATLNYLSGDFNGAQFVEGTDEASMVVGKYDGAAWSFPSIGTRDGAANTIQVTDLTSFSDFTIGKNAAALPVELTSFTASIVEGGVKLNWETATEVNNYGFNVERLANSQQLKANSWEKIGFVQGNGNSNSPKSYSFTDNAAPAGKVQYRLKQMDFDGKFEYSAVAEVEVETPNALVLYQNSPNPFNPTTEIKFALPKNSNVELSIYNLLGEKIQTLTNGAMNAGEHKISFNASKLSSGVYLYKLTTDNITTIKKMILMK